VHDLLVEDILRLEHCSTDIIPSDVLTKDLYQEPHQRHSKVLQGSCSSAVAGVLDTTQDTGTLAPSAGTADWMAEALKELQSAMPYLYTYTYVHRRPRKAAVSYLGRQTQEDFLSSLSQEQAAGVEGDVS
jgi:hypothetical protein